MKTAAKIAISLPVETLRQLDRTARHLSLSRSAAVRRALEQWTRIEQLGEQDQAYVESYLRTPEPPAALEAFGRAAVAGWGKWE
jgi:metal-responsive CopG/Arc/MetJ family transcriptional regulator